MYRYKHEVRPTMWTVTIEEGCYSDRETRFMVFSGNSPEEVWLFLCEYAKQNLTEFLLALHSDIFGKFDLRQYIKYSKQTKNSWMLGPEDIDFFPRGALDETYLSRVTIEPLKVVVTKNIKLKQI